MGIARLFFKKLYFFQNNLFLLFCIGLPLYFCEFLLKYIIYNIAQYNIAHYFLINETVPWMLSDAGLILTKSLAKPRCTKAKGYIDLVLSSIPSLAKTSGYNQPGFASHTLVREGQRVYRPGFASYTLVRVGQRVYRLGFVSHTLVRVDQRVYRLGFVSHTLARKFFRVQIA